MYKIDGYHHLKQNTLVLIFIGITIILGIFILNKKIKIQKTIDKGEDTLKLKDKDYIKIMVNGKKEAKNDLLIKDSKAIVELEYQDKLFTFIKEYIGEKYDRNKK